MDKAIEDKLEQFKKIAKSQSVRVDSTANQPNRPDSLSQVIRSKKDADDFMEQLNAVIKRG